MDTLYMGFIVIITVLVLLFFLDSALPPPARIRVIYLENLVLALLLMFSLQFAYHFPALFPQRRIESRLVLGLSLLYLITEIGLAIYRFSILSYGDVFVRPDWSDYPLLVGFPWVLVVFVRQTITVARLRHPPNGKWWRLVISPWRWTAPEGRALGYFCLINLVIIFLILTYLLRNRWLI